MLAWRKAFWLDQFDVSNFNNHSSKPAPDVQIQSAKRFCICASGATSCVGSAGILPPVLLSTVLPEQSVNMIYSADATIASQATGAMSWAFVSALKKSPQQSYVQLLNSIRDELATRYSQKPQLSCSHPLGKSGFIESCKSNHLHV